MKRNKFCLNLALAVFAALCFIAFMGCGGGDGDDPSNEKPPVVNSPLEFIEITAADIPNGSKIDNPDPSKTAEPKIPSIPYGTPADITLKLQAKNAATVIAKKSGGIDISGTGAASASGIQIANGGSVTVTVTLTEQGGKTTDLEIKLARPSVKSVAEGGAITYLPSATPGFFDEIHTFTYTGSDACASYTFEITDTSYNETGKVLIVAGGGGGGGGGSLDGGGGGGAGGFIYDGACYFTAGTYAVLVGKGGAGGGYGTSSPKGVAGTDGGNSKFGSVEPLGGGGGGPGNCQDVDPLGSNGRPGGSGGGGGAGGGEKQGTGGTGTDGQGHDGGTGNTGTAAGGGGGAGSAGDSNSGKNDNQLAGGQGISNSISETPVDYSAGGQGGCTAKKGSSPSGPGSGGGGGRGASASADGAGTEGKNGIVIVRIPYKG